METEIAFSVEQQYCSRTTSGANCGKSDRRFFEKYFHKNGDISSSCGQISLRSFQSGAFCMQIQILKTRGLGKFCSSRTSGIRVGEMDQIFGKVPSGAIYLNFLRPAGGSRTRKGAFAFQEYTIWLVETEIAFSVEEQHFIGTTAGQIHFKSACGFSENFCTKT